MNWIAFPASLVAAVSSRPVLGRIGTIAYQACKHAVRLGLIWAAILTGLTHAKAKAETLFVGSLGSGHIDEFTTAGGHSIFATGMGLPYGVAFGPGGDLYVANANSNNVYEFSPTIGMSVFATLPGFPTGIAFDASSDMFVACAGSNSIYEITPDGDQITFATGLEEPIGIAFDAHGDLFEADYLSGHIYEFNPTGSRTTFASGLSRPIGIAFSQSGILYEADFGSSDVNEFTSAGTEAMFVGLPSNPSGLTFDGSGNLFVADGGGAGTVIEITPDGVETTFARGLDTPSGLAFAPVPEPSGIRLCLVGALGAVGLWCILRTRGRYGMANANHVMSPVRRAPEW